MKKVVKPILFLGVISFLIVTLSTSVFAAEGIAGTFVEKLSEILTNALGGSSGYDYVSNILSPQILFGILVFLVIFAIISQISLFGSKTWLAVTVSIIIGLLAGGFINPAWIQPLLNQYESLGVAITFLLPFALIFYFLKEVAPTNRLVQKFVWGVYLIIAIITYVLNWNKIEFYSLANLIYFLTFAGSIVMLVLGKKFYQKFWENELDTAFDDSQKIKDLVRASQKQDAYNAYLAISGSLPAGERNRLLAQIRAIQGLPNIP